VNLALVQSECYTGKQTVITRPLKELIGIKLPRFQEIFDFAFSRNFALVPIPRGEMPVFSTLRMPMCLVLMLPNLKLHQ